MNMPLCSYPSLDIRLENELEPEEVEMLKRARLHEIGALEAWTSQGTNRQLAYATHGLVRFFGKFPPPIASYLIEKYSKPGELVLDPMAGSGTTGVECLIRDRRSILKDVNPLMLLIASVKTTKISKNKILSTLEELKLSYSPIDFNNHRSEFSGLRNPDHWFLKETMDSLYGLKKSIDNIVDKKLRDYFTVCFCGIVRRVSRATTQQGRLFLDVATAEKDAFPFFEKKVIDTADAVSSLPCSKGKIRIEQADLQNPDSIPVEKANLVILHPPYFNSYKFSSVNSLELFWLGIDHAEIRKNEVREFFKVGKPENHEKFIDDMSKALSNAYKALNPGGYMGFMMGDTAIRGEYIPVVRKTIDKAYMPYSTIEKVALRVPKYTEASWAASQRRSGKEVGVKIYDFVIVIKKNA